MISNAELHELLELAREAEDRDAPRGALLTEIYRLAERCTPATVIELVEELLRRRAKASEAGT